MATFPIIGIGASAGGLEALSELLAALPPDDPMAYVVVQHLDPDHSSLLVELLGRKTSLPVVQIEDDMEVDSSHVYVIPPDAALTLAGRRFVLTQRADSGPHHPVDVFFSSLAEEHGEAAIGVVLSGGDSDGSSGVQAIKHNGGITFAQEPASARFSGMPQHAIETGCVDFVLRPGDIAKEIGRLGSHPYLHAPAQALQAEANQEPGPAAEEEQLRCVFRRLRSAHGVDFMHYKRSTLRRRLARRMALAKIDELAEYLTLLEDNPAEMTALYQDFLIRVTGFFRDPQSFEGLTEQVFPTLDQGRSSSGPIRIWVPGCASGEEVYSIAITLVEYLGDRLAPSGIQIFGSDVSEAAIEKARAAVYMDIIEQDVSNERLERFFVKADGHYRIAKSIRDLCIFARQDVMRDPPFSRLDLVSCRNLLIYLDAPAQRRVLQMFHYSLRPQGYLMLGPAESVGAASGLFELVDKQHRLYARRATAPGAGSGLGPRTRSLDGLPGASRRGGESAEAGDVDSALREADRLLLARYAPASLLVDEALNILQFRGETGPFVEHASGPPSLNLHRMLRPELLVEISPAIAQARETGSVALRGNLTVGELNDVTVEVVPLKAAGRERCYLIVFADASKPPSVRRAPPAVASAPPESEKDRRLAQLEREIGASRAYLQSTIEEHEAVKEELKSASEEVLSANEEFQSTNEELETAKEELQSTNEELTTTNDELRSLNRELAALNVEVQKARAAAERAAAYADAIVASVREPLLVLDADLRILRANPAFCTVFRTQPKEVVGRLLTQAGAARWNWNNNTLMSKLREILSSNTVLDDYDMQHEFPDSGLRVLRMSARKIPGTTERAELILLAIEDVTERNKNIQRLREADQRKDEFLAMLAHELRNPLSPIRHATALLRRSVAGGSRPELYDLIDRQATRLTRLVDDLLDVSRISRGRIELRRETVDLVLIAAMAAKAVRHRIDEHRHQLVLTMPDAPVFVDGDAVRLEQVVSNLLDNAAKYTDPGGRIELAVQQDNEEAQLIVRDNGIGLAKESLNSVFELFTQVDSSLARSSGGLGIGLTVVQRIVELHGGRIEARSLGLGQGTEFIARLPLASSIETEPVPGTGAQPKTAATAAPAAKIRRRVLIADDNADAAYTLAELLRMFGHEVAVALDGPSALELAQRFDADCALLDVGLPGIDGYELARRLRGQAGQRNLYLIAITGYGSKNDRAAATAAGFDRHLVKPVDIDALQELLGHETPVPSHR